MTSKSDSAETAEAIIYGEDRPAESFVEEVEFFASWGDALLKETLPFLNQVLRQFVTLNAALLAGVAAFSDKGLMDRGLSITSMVLLLLALSAAIIGILPHGGWQRRCAGLEIREAVRGATEFKNWCVWLSAVMLLAALVVLTVGIIAR